MYMAMQKICIDLAVTARDVNQLIGYICIFLTLHPVIYSGCHTLGHHPLKKHTYHLGEFISDFYAFNFALNLI